MLSNILRKSGLLLYDTTEEPKRLIQEAITQRERIDQLKKEYKKVNKRKVQYSGILDFVTSSMNSMIWQKDAFDRYTFTNSLHCAFFFSLTDKENCYEKVIGKTDEELICELYESQNIPNSLGRMGLVSDRFVLLEGKMGHFMEAGVVGEDQVLLYVIKAPIKNEDGKFAGTTGIAWDISDQSCPLVKLLNRWSFDGFAQELYSDESVFSYHIKPAVKKCDDIFKQIKSNRKRGE